MKNLFTKSKRSKKTTQVARLPNIDDVVNCLIPPPPPPTQSTDATTSSGCNPIPVATAELAQQKSRGHQITLTPTFGIDQTFDQVSNFLINDEVGGIGIYGMGGVGKTTLMKRIHQEFLLPCGFLVIWITVSKTTNIVDKIQRAIMKEMRLAFDPDEDVYNRAQSICIKLVAQGTRSVALLLDDIWDHVDLEEVLGSTELDPSFFKIVFTTRLKKVCKQMKAHKEIKMECLEWDDSWALFEKTVGRGALYDSNVRIMEFAKDVAKECKGLPLALIVIGRAMAGMTSVEEWQSALSTLRNSPSEYAEKKMFPQLKFSYDMLPTQMAKDCFLHCCSYPEDARIRSEELIDVWFGEGLLGSNRRYVEAHNKGCEIIGILEAACLLEKQNKSRIKMHDIIREMGLWVLCDDKLSFIHDSGFNLSNEEIDERWTVARRIFISEKCILPEQPTCHNLLALLQNEPARFSVQNCLFELMPKLRVLHLNGVEFNAPPVAISTLSELRYLQISNSNLRLLPEDLGKLTKLMVLRLEHNHNLVELPSSIGHLVELRKLLLNTVMKELPIGLTNLNRLEELTIRDDLGRGGVVRLATSNFAGMVGLRTLDLFVTNYNVFPPGLWELTNLETLTIRCKEYQRNQVGSVAGLGRLRSIQRLQLARCPFVNCIELSLALQNMKKLAYLYLYDIPIDASILLLTPNLQYLTKLKIGWCSELREIQIGEFALPSLRTVVISDCKFLQQISGLQHLISLVKLRIEDCPVVELVKEGQNFPKLRVLELNGLQNLTTICDDSVMLPSLAEFRFSCCPKLNRLPRGLMNENRSLKTCDISASFEWWKFALARRRV